MKLFRWITLLFRFLGLVKEAEDLAAGKYGGKQGDAPAAGQPRDETDRDDRFHLNQ